MRCRFLIFALIFAISFGCAGCSSKKSEENSSLILAVENNLRPGFIIKGEPVRTVNIFDRMKQLNVPGASLAIINNGKVEWAKGYGIRERGCENLVTTETLFQAASISKPVAALGILHLVDKGLLNLDAPVNDKLKSWHIPDNEFTKDKKVSLKGLLNHSAGLTVNGFPGYSVKNDIPTIIQVLEGEEPSNTDPIRVDIIPGSQWRYSGGGYTVVQLLITDTMGKSFNDYMKETVLDPIGMIYSTFEQPLSGEAAMSAASGHRGNNEVVKGKWHIYPEKAAAGLWTTPSDLCRFAIEIQKSLAGQSNEVISKSLTEQMLTPGIGGFGLGFALSGNGEVVAFYHGGSNEGFRCKLVAFAKEFQGAVVMTNSDNGWPLIREIIRSIAYVYKWPIFQSEEVNLIELESSVIEAYVGEFTMSNNPDMVFIFSVKDGRLFFKPIEDTDIALYPISKTEFVCLDDAHYVTFVESPDGNFDKIKIRSIDSSKELILVRKSLVGR